MTTRGMRYGIPGDFGTRPGTIEVVAYGCAPPDSLPWPPDIVSPWPAPEPVPCPSPIPVGGMVEVVRQRLVEARQSRNEIATGIEDAIEKSRNALVVLDAEIETLERMLRAAGVEP